MNSKKWTEVNGVFIVIGKQASAARHLLGGRASVLGSSDGLLPADCVDVAAVAGQLRDVRDNAAAQFSGRYELADAVATALACGEHCFTLGPPGTAKTALLKLLARGIGGSFWAYLLGNETTSENVFGPISTKALKNDQWDRAWSGLATCHVALIDEIWEAGSGVTNIIKTALEEREVTSGNVVQSIPLLTAISASNIVPDDKMQSADWDRWLLRLPVGYLSDSDQFRKMLTADAGTVAVSSPLEPEDIALLAAAVELISLDPPPALVAGIMELWRELGQNGRAISDRRWRKTLKAAVAYALLNGETPDKHHLAVSRWTLWQEPEEYQEISDKVLGLTDPVASDVLDVEALGEALKQTAETLGTLDWEERARVGTQARKLLRQVSTVESNPASAKYQARLDGVRNESQAVLDSIMGMMD